MRWKWNHQSGSSFQHGDTSIFAQYGMLNIWRIGDKILSSNTYKFRYAFYFLHLEGEMFSL